MSQFPPGMGEQLAEQRQRDLVARAEKGRRSREARRRARSPQALARRRSATSSGRWRRFWPLRRKATDLGSSSKSHQAETGSQETKQIDDQYDTLPFDYATDSAESPYNDCYERPAMISLLGNVAGCRVLEVGRGPGLLSAWLVEHKAVVTSCDVRPKVVTPARRGLGDRAEVVVADLSQPLTFASDHSFDLVVASQVMHYVEDWQYVFREFGTAEGLVST